MSKKIEVRIYEGMLEDDSFPQVKKIINSLPEVENNKTETVYYGQRHVRTYSLNDKFNIVLYFGDYPYSNVDITTLCKEIDSENLSKDMLLTVIKDYYCQYKKDMNRLSRLHRVYKKRGYLYSKFKQTRDFLLEQGMILRQKPWNNSTYEVLTWNPS